MTITRQERRQFVEFRGSTGSRLPHLPGLDGLRGLAVVIVVLFHAELGPMAGGYLGVSTFFTLSGFLITALLLSECDEHDRVDLRGFWRRRFRRLLPASTVTLFLIATVFATWFATSSQLGRLRGQILSALTQVTNWQFIFSGASYVDLFSAPSPVLHFWSLAIEEQFYLLFPLLIFGLWRLTRGRRSVLAMAIGGLALFSALEPFLFTMSQDRIYFGTDTRAVELLLGSLLALLLGHQPVRRKLSAPGPIRLGVVAIGVVCLGVQIYWWWSVGESSPWLYRGGFALYALMTCVIITAAILPGTPFRPMFTAKPLKWLGARSYGIYLLHWPIFLAIRQTWVSAPLLPRTALSIALSLVAAELSFRVIEQPIRAARWPSRQRFPQVAGVSILAVAILVVVSLPAHTTSKDPLDFEQAASDIKNLTQQQKTTTTTAAPEVVPTPVVNTFGDSTAMLLGLGMVYHAAASKTMIGLAGDAALGCGVSRFTSRRVEKVFSYTDECRAWPTRWQAAIDSERPDVAQLVTGAWEVTDAKIPGATKFSALGDPAVDAFVKSELTTAVDILGSRGALVLLVLWPQDSRAAATAAGSGQQRASDPARMNRLHQLMREIAAERPDNVKIVDLAGHLADRLEDGTLRPDGRHIPAEQAQTLYQDWLGPLIIDLWSDYWRSGHRPEAAEPSTPSAGGSDAPPSDPPS